MKFPLLIALIVLFSAASCDKSIPDRPVVDEKKPDTSVKEKGNQIDAPHSPKDFGPPAPAIYFMSGLKGYTEPCGCTLDIKLGGIDRLVAFYEDTQSFHPHRLAVHVGDLFFENTVSEENRPAEEERVRLISESLKKLQIKITVPGPKDFALGAPFYLSAAKRSGVQVIASNLQIGDTKIEGSATLELGEDKVGFVSIIDPKHFKDVEKIKISEPNPAEELKNIVNTDIKVLLANGDELFARKYAEGFDFVVVGIPRETDQTDLVKGAWTLESYDQGRYVGVLKIYNAKKEGGFKNANQASKSELEKINKQISRVEKQISGLIEKGVKESEFLKNIRKKKDGLEKEAQRIKNARVEISKTNPSFIWRSLPMEPELRNDPTFEAKRKQYNKSLKELSAKVERKVTPVKQGEAEYVGSQQCATCHVQETIAWKTTRHSNAFATLEKRDKDFDHKCVGCHSVGYEKPGGSVLGKFTYDADILLASGTHPEKNLSRHIKKSLTNVGCENCHGPASQHILLPVSSDGTMNINAKPTVDACMQCHVPEHSPSFDFQTYIKKIVIPGHGLASTKGK